MGSLFRDTGRALTGLFSKRHNRLDDVRPGATYQAVHIDQMVETAKVLAVAPDSFGIPHVRFQVSFSRSQSSIFDGGARMLALDIFAERYKPIVAH